MKRFLKVLSLACVSTVFLTCLPGCSGQQTGASNNSSHAGGYQAPDNMTVLIAFGAGGGVDVFGRQTCFFMNDLGLSDEAFIYENQSGGSGQVGWGAVIEQHGGDESYLIPAASNSLCSGKISGKQYSYLDMTCVAEVCCDYRVLVTSAGSGFQTLEDLIAEGKERQLVASTSGIGSVSHMVIMELADKAGIDVRVVPYESPEDVTSVLGNQVDFTVASPGELAQYIDSGDLLALAVASEERLPYFPDSPTFTECGYEIVQKTTRGFLMPAGVSEEAVKYWQNLLEQVCQSEEFLTGYIEPYYMTLEYAPGEEWKEDLDAEYARMEEVMTELGLAA